VASPFCSGDAAISKVHGARHGARVSEIRELAARSCLNHEREWSLSSRDGDIFLHVMSGNFERVLSEEEGNYRKTKDLGRFREM